MLVVCQLEATQNNSSSSCKKKIKNVEQRKNGRVFCIVVSENSLCKLTFCCVETALKVIMYQNQQKIKTKQNIKLATST